MSAQGHTDIPAGRAATLREVGARLLAAKRVVLTTHVGADADGVGSQGAVAAWLEGRGIAATIVNPSPVPEGLRFLLHRPDLAPALGTKEATAALSTADLLLVLDTSESGRIAPLDTAFERARIMVVDHHPAGPSTVGDLALQDPTAAATGELVHDLLSLFDAAVTGAVALGVYVAIVSDTGSFRFSNTNARVHRIAASLLEGGVDPEAVFKRLFATVPLRRIELLREALAGLQTDPAHGISWIVVANETAERLGATAEDFEGLVDHARSIEGTRVAILFRETAAGHTKISLRATGATDVNVIAREFGGGGHVKAAGAVIEEPPTAAVPRVVEAVRTAIKNYELRITN